jgi:hypothetical protein
VDLSHRISIGRLRWNQIHDIVSTVANSEDLIPVALASLAIHTCTDENAATAEPRLPLHAAAAATGPNRGAPQHSDTVFPMAASTTDISKQPKVRPCRRLPSARRLGTFFLSSFHFFVWFGCACVPAFGGGLGHDGRVVAVEGGGARPEDRRRRLFWKVAYFLKMHLPLC